MINTKDQILGLIQRNQDSIRGFGVSKIGLFGSYARGEQNDNSDIDIIVQFERDKKKLFRIYQFGRVFGETF